MKTFTDQSELSTQDIADLKSITFSAAANARALIRKKLNKQPYSVITYGEYKRAYGIT